MRVAKRRQIRRKPKIESIRRLLIAFGFALMMVGLSFIVGFGQDGSESLPAVTQIDYTEPQPELDASEEVLEEAAGVAPSQGQRPGRRHLDPSSEEEEESYTERLLKAKEKLWKEKKK